MWVMSPGKDLKKKKSLSNEVKKAPGTDPQFNFICQENIGANTENTST